jgi:hypothetical protein
MLSCTNSSKSAYARFTFAAAYWKKWAISRQPLFTFSTQQPVEEVRGEVSIKVREHILGTLNVHAEFAIGVAIDLTRSGIRQNCGKR